MTGAQGTATLTFPVAAQAAQYSYAQVVSDSHPNPYGQFVVATNATFTSSVVSNGKIILAGHSSFGSLNVSYDYGATWSVITFPTLSTVSVLVSYASGYFIATNVSTTASAWSTDAVNWTTFTAALNGASYLGYGGGNHLYANATSLWATPAMGGGAGTVGALPSGTISYSGLSGKWVAINGTNYSYSATGSPSVAWTAGTAPWTSASASASNINGHFAINSTGPAYRSNDAINWVSVPISGTPNGKICSHAVSNRVQFGTSTGTYITDDLNAIAYVGSFTAGDCGFRDYGYLRNPSGGVLSGNSYSDRTVNIVQTLIEPALPCPGSNVAIVTVTGQSGLLSTDYIDAWIQASDSTASHNAAEHKIVPIRLSVSNVIAGTGFDITGITELRLDGDFQVRWVWSR